VTPTHVVDDVINVSGHRLGTAEIENVLLEHHAVSEAAVVGVPHEIKGQGITAYVTTCVGVTPDENLKEALINHLRQEIGSFAKLDHIQWVEGLPKTRSGKIMRRILRKIACGEGEDLGDISTLADPTVLDNLRG